MLALLNALSLEVAGQKAAQRRRDPQVVVVGCAGIQADADIRDFDDILKKMDEGGIWVFGVVIHDGSNGGKQLTAVSYVAGIFILYKMHLRETCASSWQQVCSYTTRFKAHTRAPMRHYSPFYHMYTRAEFPKAQRTHTFIASSRYRRSAEPLSSSHSSTITTRGSLVP